MKNKLDNPILASQRTSMSRRKLLKTSILSSVAFGAGVTAVDVMAQSTAPKVAASSSSSSLWRPKHVVLVILENKQFSDFFPNKNMPYLNELGRDSALFDHCTASSNPYKILPKGRPFDAPKDSEFKKFLPTRDSQPNYMVIFSGHHQGLFADWFQDVNSPYIGTAYHDIYGNLFDRPMSNVNVGIGDSYIPSSWRPFVSPNLGAAFVHAGFGFATFSENLPHPLFDGDRFDPDGVEDGYVRRHNPALNWMNLPGLTIAIPEKEKRFLVPVDSNRGFHPTTDENGKKYGGFAVDQLGAPQSFDKLPTFSIVIPNDMDNAHTGSRFACDQWLEKNIKPYADWAKKNDSLLVITTDEDHFNNAVVTSPGVGNSPISRISREQHKLMYDMAPIPVLFHGPQDKIKTGVFHDEIDHINLLATYLDMYGLLEGFKNDYLEFHGKNLDAFRRKEMHRYLDNMKPIRSIFKV